MRFSVVGCALAGALACAASAQADVGVCNAPMKMSDGKVMRANLILPGDGKGSYPSAVTITGYNKDVSNPTGDSCPTTSALSKAGYVDITIDDRGTGSSQDQWQDWDARTQKDYEEELDWIQAQKWSDGDVAMHGGSYLGITSLLAAEADARRVAAGKPRAVKAVWADVPMADAYRDVTFHGGATDSGFMPLWLGLVNGVNAPPPSTMNQDPAGSTQTWIDHLTGDAEFAGLKLADATTGGDAAYDGDFYRLRSPVEHIEDITIPVAWTGGWWDIFQRGEPLLYEKMVNSPHRTFFMTPNYHGSPDPTAWAAQGYGDETSLMIKWFDRWVRHVDSDVIDGLAPVNLFTMGEDEWQHVQNWPVPGTDYTPFYLDPTVSGSANSLNDGTLAATPPAADGGDLAPLLPASSPCSRLTAQWTAGTGKIGNCETDNSTFEATALTWTTPPLSQDTELTGLTTADLWATVDNATDATLVAVLSDVDESGASNQVTAGFLLASQRANDPAKTTYAPTGEVIRPYHPFTRESQKPVESGKPEHYLIEIYPTSNVFAKGHRIRLTLATANTPSTSTPVPDLVNEAGGTITVLNGPGHPSNVLLPVHERGEGTFNRKAALRRAHKRARRAHSRRRAHRHV